VGEWVCVCVSACILLLCILSRTAGFNCVQTECGSIRNATYTNKQTRIIFRSMSPCAMLTHSSVALYRQIDLMNVRYTVNHFAP
jgi:hypothetical protein